MSETVISVVGHIGSDVDHREVGSGTHLSTFRLATTPRYWDRAQRTYVDGTTNWLSVQCWRALALHVSTSVSRGDPVIVIGKLKTQEWEKEGVRSSRLILEATAVGHDLNRGVSSFTKIARTTEPVSDHAQAALEAAREVEQIPVAGAREEVAGTYRLADAS
ncbi:MAG: single-stranded DNA-binding protein [Nocardioidaceae bacterium]